MENIDYIYLCTAMGNLSGIPIRLYKGEERLFFHSLVQLPKDPMELYRDEIWGVKANVGNVVTRHLNYYGIVNSGEIKIVIGPTCQVGNNDQELRELAFRSDVLPEDVDEFVAGMKSIVRMPLESILQILCTLNYLLNGEKLGLEDITILESEQKQLKTLLEKQRNTQIFTEEPKDGSGDLHNTYGLEQKLLHMVRKGDTAALKEWIASAPAIRGGTLASDQLRQVKNTFIVSATLVSRAAIQGGMESEDALSLSDAFIQRCELLNSLYQITNLQYHMVLDFTERMEKIRFGKRPTRLTIEVSNYIQNHLSEPIRTEEIARKLYMSRPYLSQKFKEETGETLTNFILREKTEEAKRLLRYTDKSAAAISSYLGFSSQSHFSRVFRKYTGHTPGEYREKHAGQ